MLLAPGWHTGIFYFLLCVACFAGAMILHGGLSPVMNDEIQTFVSGAAVIVFPLLLIHLFFSRITSPPAVFGIYLLIQCCAAVVAFFLLIMADETPVGETAYLLVPIPMTAFFAALVGDESIPLVVISLAVAAVSLLVAFLRGLPLYRDAIRILRALRAHRG